MSKIQETGRADLLERLKQAQHRYGYLPEKTIARIAKALDIPVGEVYGVATFYSFLATKPQGRNIIRVCKSLPCFLKNSRMIIESIEGEMGIKPGETTPDGRFSFQLTNCIGACDKAPAMMINSDVHTDLTPDKIAQILQAYK
ncbi:MAG TPA: NADH-quinone oxidoreductase subunit NuoE [Dehalococcoidales bacterium]|nr:NADH-quinone oxidoreductase subunit NuoE [Dehalococcoidales bacterium]